MIITCPQCLAQYGLDGALIGPEGRPVRCSACGYQWLAEPPTPAGEAAREDDSPPPAPADAAAVDVMGGDISAPTAAEAAAAPDEWAAGGSPEPSQPTSDSSSGRAVPTDEPAKFQASAPVAAADLDLGEAAPVAKAEGDQIAPLPELAGEPVQGDEVVTRIGAPRRHPEAGGDGDEPPEEEDINAFRARIKAAGGMSPIVTSKPQRPGLGGGMTAMLFAALALVATLAILVLAREPIMQALPAATSLYAALGLASEDPTAGLDIRNVSSTRERRGYEEVLVVEGVVANVGHGDRSVPPIRVSLFDAADKELQFVTTTIDRNRLDPGESAAFRAQLVAPADSARRIRVSLADQAQGS
jgi:predicted Zn finger-like uncharacterized protein